MNHAIGVAIIIGIAAIWAGIFAGMVVLKKDTTNMQIRQPEPQPELEPGEFDLTDYSEATDEDYR